jgi:hypothetical protein
MNNKKKHNQVVNFKKIYAQIKIVMNIDNESTYFIIISNSLDRMVFF